MLDKRLYPWQQDSWPQLMQLSEKSHAVLVSGEKGIGKASLVRHWLNKLLCQQSLPMACGQCPSCLLMQAGTHPDYSELLPDGRQIKVAQVRAVIDKLNQTAQLAGKKIVLIDPAENLNIAGANALLKCLEEPSGNSLLVLLSHNPQRLLPTIRSRCQQLSLKKPSEAQAKAFLTEQLSEHEALDELLYLSHHNPLLAKEWADDGALALYQSFKQQLESLKDKGNIVRIADGLQKQIDAASDKNQMLQYWLVINQRILWPMILQRWQLNAAPFILESAQSGRFAQKAYQLLDKVQSLLADVQSQSNPNSLLLIESVLMDWQHLLTQR